MGSSATHHIDIDIYTQGDLQSNPQLNASLVDVINAAFGKHTAFEDKPRFEDANELPEQIGPDGLCAVARYENSILGSASFQRWRPEAGSVVDKALQQRPTEHKLAAAGLSYEAKAIVTVDGPLSRGKGLVGMMIQALLEKLQTARHPGREVLLWLQLSEEHNGAYWRRRGFEQVGPIEIKPKGTWGSHHDFEFCTMVKRMPALAVA